MVTDNSTEASGLPRLHIVPEVFLVSDDLNSAHADDPLTLEGVRGRLLVLHSRLSNQCAALNALRGALAGDHTVPPEVAFILDQFVLAQDVTEDLGTLIVELTGPPAFGFARLRADGLVYASHRRSPEGSLPALMSRFADRIDQMRERWTIGHVLTRSRLAHRIRSVF